MGRNAKDVRTSPYPPSFRRIAARIIEPATGASTWALGSQRWTKNNGSFTIKARHVRIHHIDKMFWEILGINHCINRKVWPEFE